MIALALAIQKWVENFAKEWVEYPFLAMPAKANDVANAQYERTLSNNPSIFSLVFSFGVNGPEKLCVDRPQSTKINSHHGSG